MNSSLFQRVASALFGTGQQPADTQAERELVATGVEAGAGEP